MLHAHLQQGVLLDQFGVLHDGKHAYSAAPAAVRRLAEAGVSIVIVSNSSRRSGGTLGKLARMGFQEEWFAGAAVRVQPAQRANVGAHACSCTHARVGAP